MSRLRDLSWDGCLNVRDLGGLPTLDGGETRFGRIVRADSVRQLTGAGWEAAVAYGIRTIVDLRGDHERDEDPPAEIPIRGPARPVHGGGRARLDGDRRPRQAAASAAADDETATRDVYLVFVEHFRENVGAACAPSHARRKGASSSTAWAARIAPALLTALVLHLAGVPAVEIAADYALSEVRLRPRHDEWLAQAESDAERERLRQIARTPAASMVGVLAELERRYGSVEQFLREAGVRDDDLARAGARLRG